jgi:putative tryptophan/tyrosine transport system substrate-binding protein
MRALFGAMLGLGASIWAGFPAVAQRAEPARVGLLSLHSLEQENAAGTGASAFRMGMQALGYREGQNLIIYERHAEGDRARLQSLAAELLSARIEVIIAVGTDATEAAREITSSIPIVMAGVGDPLASGFAASLARPGGNMTGIAIWGDEAAQKQLEMLREAAPHIRKVGVLRLRTSAHDRRFKRLENTAAPLGLSLIGAEVTNADDLPTRFADVISSGAEAFLVLANPSFDDLRGRIAELGLRHKLPGAGHQPYYVRAGLLLSYGPSLTDLHARSATYVDKILKGAKPADLPVEQAERFTLAVNLRTAKSLGLSIPPTLLARADEVIE